ncbi:hypothetical protein PMAYCL1PPCAC_19867, partial [Pristionchus mayeri]
EKKRRPYISVGLLSIDVIIGVIYASNRALELFDIPNPIVFTLAFAVGFAPTAIAVTLVVINKRRLKGILLSNNYTLSTKYQLQENLWAFK